MVRKKLTKYDVEGVAQAASEGEMPINEALAILGRSTRLDQASIDRIAEDFSMGYKLRAIAARNGIGARLLQSWLRRGEARRHELDDWRDRRADLPESMTKDEVEQEIGPEPVENDLLLLYDTCARAEANGECALVDIIRDDAMIAGNVSSAKWLLQARYEDWKAPGKLPRHEEMAPAEDTIEVLFNKINEVVVKKKILEEAKEARDAAQSNP